MKHVMGNQTLLLRKVVSLVEFLSQDTAMNYKYDRLPNPVGINKLDYLNKMKQLISDETKFKKLARNPTKSREDTLISHLR